MFHVTLLCLFFSLKKLSGVVDAALGRQTVMNPMVYECNQTNEILPPARTTCWSCSRRDGQLVVCNQQNTRLPQLFDRFDMRCLFFGTDFLNSHKGSGAKTCGSGVLWPGHQQMSATEIEAPTRRAALDKNKR